MEGVSCCNDSCGCSDQNLMFFFPSLTTQLSSQLLFFSSAHSVKRVEENYLLISIDGTDVSGLCHKKDFSDERVKDLEAMIKVSLEEVKAL